MYEHCSPLCTLGEIYGTLEGPRGSEGQTSQNTRVRLECSLPFPSFSAALRSSSLDTDLLANGLCEAGPCLDQLTPFFSSTESMNSIEDNRSGGEPVHLRQSVFAEPFSSTRLDGIFPKAGGRADSPRRMSTIAWADHKQGLGMERALGTQKLGV